MQRTATAAAAVITVAALFYLGEQPFAVDLFPEPWDKLAHLLCFGGIAALLFYCDGGRHPRTVIILVSMIGMLDESHQGRLPGRNLDVGDLLTDALAAYLAVTACQWLARRRT
jgi:VanZ family protein